MKTRTIYICQSCGYQSAKWLGKCPDCEQWNSLIEELKTEEPGKTPHSTQEPSLLLSVDVDEGIRTSTGLAEFDRILGGGIVKGSVVLIGGDPGIGKSTLLLQACDRLAASGCRVLYVTGEESVKQTKLRANRLGVVSGNLYIVNQTNAELIKGHIAMLKPEIAVVDSVQVTYSDELSSSPGSVSQIRHCAGLLTQLAKASSVSLFLIGHVTKEGALAGPRVLEHLVDTVLYFEGDRFGPFRLLRAVKNRFGSTNEIGVFQMSDKGLVEISNPSSVFLAERPKDVSGSVVIVTVEGTRPLSVEVQALVSPSAFGIPTRRSMGIDYNKLSLLIAVLERRLQLNLHNFDIFVNVAGGLRILEPAADLGIVVSIASAFCEKPVNINAVVIGEVGLGAEVRAISQTESRIAEAKKQGFKRCILPKANLKGIFAKPDIELIGVSTVKEALEAALI